MTEQLLYDICFAIFNLDYDTVEALLKDENLPINSYFNKYLPREYAVATCDPKMIRLFLDCPRVEWLHIYSAGQLAYTDPSTLSKKFLRASIRLDPMMEKTCPEEAKSIYDKIIDAVKDEPEEDLEELPFQVCHSGCSPYLLEKALKYCKDINKRNSEGLTLLNSLALSASTLDLKNVKSIIALGADLNIPDYDGETALMHCINHVGLAKFLIERGADVNAKDKCGRTALDFCEPKEIYDQYEEIDFYIENYPITEVIFKSLLNKRIWSKLLERIFAMHPEYIKIFESNLPENLALLAFDEHEWFKQITPKDAHIYLKKMISIRAYTLSQSFYEKYPVIKLAAQNNADDLLALAVEKGDCAWIKVLVLQFHANPNAVVDGLPLLFKTGVDSHGLVIKTLLDLGADPSVKVDGCYFFQREGFTTKWEPIWILELYKRDFDLFEPSPLTGKTVFECISTKRCSERDMFDFDAKIVTPKFLSRLAEGKFDYHEPLDEQKNTIMHYFALNLVDLRSRQTISDLIRAKNVQGQSALDLLVQTEHAHNFMTYRLNIESPNDLECLESVYNQHHGIGSFDSKFLASWGSQFMIFAMNISDSKYLRRFCSERKLKIQADLVSRGTCNPAWLPVFLEYEPVTLDMCGAFNKPEQLRQIVDHVFSTRNDYDKIFFEFLISAFELFPKHREVTRLVLGNENIQFLIKSNPLYSAKLDKYFFTLCNSVEDVQFFLDVGLDPKRLVGVNVLACRDKINWRDPLMWLYLRDSHGMSIEDFDNILAPIESSDDPIYAIDNRFISLANSLKNGISFSSSHNVFLKGMTSKDSYLTKLAEKQATNTCCLIS